MMFLFKNKVEYQTFFIFIKLLFLIIKYDSNTFILIPDKKKIDIFTHFI
jgi:hypothetical protein